MSEPLTAVELVELRAHHSHFPDGERRAWCRLCDRRHGVFMERLFATIDPLQAEITRLRESLNEACDWLKRLQEAYDPTDTEDGIVEIERLRMSEGSYHWTNHEHNEEYETLFRPDGTEVTTITEPEDRNFYRDLAPVCVELNALQAEIARLREQADAATALAERATDDAATATRLYQAASKRADTAREQAEALAAALRNQGLLQNTFHGKVWHIYDCPASFDFSECNYRCRVAREAFALAGMEPYVSPETRRDTEVYE